MNGVEPVLRAIDQFPDRAALLFPGEQVMRFHHVHDRALRFQQGLKALGLEKGDCLLLAEGLKPELYSFVLAALGLGISVAVVEPWMKLSRINSVVGALRPKLFIAAGLGRLWGIRASQIRAIPTWMSLAKLSEQGSREGRAKESLEICSMNADDAGLIAFTSGTTGLPKGVARRHGYLLEQHKVLASNLHHEAHAGPELTIFTNFVFANLASGRGSVVIPPKWRSRDLRWAGQLENELAPETATVGPAFLRRLTTEPGFSGLRSIHVGGALTDCSIFESAFGRYREAEFLHIYGSSEAEPVAVMNAREAVALSRERGQFQTLALGRPIRDIRYSIEPSTVWVAGAHVCPLYVGAPEYVDEENRRNKRRDESGSIWHAMGDRVIEREGLWWYGGRASQREADFTLEQNLYSQLQTSKAFIQRNSDTELKLFVEGDQSRMSSVGRILDEWQASGLLAPNAKIEVFRTEIVRDQRHRARIDRDASQKKARPFSL